MLKTDNLKTQPIIIFGIFILTMLFYNNALYLCIVLQLIEYLNLFSLIPPSFLIPHAKSTSPFNILFHLT